MSKQIKLTDEVYVRLKGAADDNFRSLSGQVDYLLSYEEATPVARAVAAKPDVTPAKKIDFDTIPVPVIKKQVAADSWEPTDSEPVKVFDGGFTSTKTPEETSRQPAEARIRRQIAEHQALLDGADETNQDPDYAAEMKAHQGAIEMLWTQWHKVTGR